MAIQEKLNAVSTGLFDGCGVELYGSAVNGFALSASSDIDCTILYQRHLK